MFGKLKSIFSSKKRNFPIERDEWVITFRHLINSNEQVCSYFKKSLIPEYLEIVNAFDDVEINSSDLEKIVRAFFCHRAITMIGNLNYVSHEDGPKFTDAMCQFIYNDSAFENCRYIQSFYNSSDDKELREIFSDFVTNNISNGRSSVKHFLRPFVVLNAIDLDFLSCALTAGSFSDEVNKNAILKQREKALKLF